MMNADPNDFLKSLLSAGNDSAQAQSRAAVLAQADRLLDGLIADKRDDAVSFLVPGRIEFLGKHTDYAGGRSLLCAVERGFAVIAVPRKDRTIRIANPLGGPPIVFDLDPQLHVTTGHWSNYAMTVARRLARNFPTAVCGADIAFASDLPPSAGMSSSSALMIAIYLVLARVNRLDELPAYRENIKNIEELAGSNKVLQVSKGFSYTLGSAGAVGPQ